jgi:tyrosine-protein phosphatase YwqE
MSNPFNQSTLKDSIPHGFVDIHNHVLPNIDDGPASLDESLALIKQLHSLGIKKIVCTPHIMEGIWENSHEVIRVRVQQLKDQLQRNNFSDINLHGAAEYMVDDLFRNHLKQRDLLTFGGNKVLIEVHFANPPMDFYELMFDMQLSGYKPVIAHPERYDFIGSNFNELNKLKAAGCQLQLNLLAVGGYYGKLVQQLAKKILKKGLYDFVGTDSHHAIHVEQLLKMKGHKLMNLLQPVLLKNSKLPWNSH